jgi:hypothetical protein
VLLWEVTLKEAALEVVLEVALLLRRITDLKPLESLKNLKSLKSLKLKSLQSLKSTQYYMSHRSHKQPHKSLKGMRRSLSLRIARRQTAQSN